MSLIKRQSVYAQKPSVYGISGCKCGDPNPQWSEYEDHLWCEKCQIDFMPECKGVFDGPILLETCEAMGIFFHRINLETEQFEIFMPDNFDESGQHKLVPVSLKPAELAALKRFFSRPMIEGDSR